jgi:putative OPT family oligopeptide transporter
MTKEFKPLISANTSLKEFTLRALLIGLVLAVVLGAANAYLGLKAGMTIAATYPAAVLGMALLRLFKDSSIAAGAIFTLPGFLIAGVWSPELFASFEGYWKSTVIMLAGGIVGILFVTLLRRVMVEDPELPFPESIAASEIHKAGRSGATGAKYLFYAMGIGGLVEFLKNFHILAEKWETLVIFAKKIIPGTGIGAGAAKFSGVETGGGFLLKSPSLSPAFFGVGYIIGPRLAALNFAGGVLAWGLFVPLLYLLLAPGYADIIGTTMIVQGKEMLIDGAFISKSIFGNIVKPIAIGGMLMSAAYTLWGMRKSLSTGIKRSIGGLWALLKGILFQLLLQVLL